MTVPALIIRELWNGVWWATQWCIISLWKRAGQLYGTNKQLDANWKSVEAVWTSRLTNDVTRGIAIFELFLTYLSFFWGGLRGRINPRRHTFRVAGSPEAFSDFWLKLAYINIAFGLGGITLVFCILFPMLRVYQPLDWIVPSLFVVGATCLIYLFWLIWPTDSRYLHHNINDLLAVTLTMQQ